LEYWQDIGGGQQEDFHLDYKSFKQFVAEKWSRGDPTSVSPKYTRRYALTHTGKVGNHEVNVTIKHLDKEHHAPGLKGLRNIDFSVNGSYDEEDIPAKDGHKILHHVHKVIKHYIERRKPREVEMAGNTEEKSKVYKRYGEHLAKTLGGSTRGDSVVTKFTPGKKKK
jgi:hypothetical protein